MQIIYIYLYIYIYIWWASIYSLFTDGEWRVFVTTSNKANSDTGSQVFLTVFGDKGNSGPLPLGSPGGSAFQSGATDEFDVSLIGFPNIIISAISLALVHLSPIPAAAAAAANSQVLWPANGLFICLCVCVCVCVRACVYLCTMMYRYG